jgi:flavodoxin
LTQVNAHLRCFLHFVFLAGQLWRAQMTAKRVLIAFYSRSGTTRKIAEALAAQLECDVDEIVASESHTGFIGILRSLVSAMRHRPAQIAAASRDPSSYDLVVIGTPVWAWSVSSPVRAYLMQNANKLSDVAFFCTMGGRGDKGTFAQMQALVGKAPRAKAAFTMQDVVEARSAPQLAAFIQALGSPVSSTNDRRAA